MANINKIRILLVSPVAPPKGGMATWTELYSEEVKKYEEIEMDILNTAFIGKNVQTMKATSITDEIKRNLQLIKRAYEQSNKGDYDIIHFNSAGNNIGVIREAIMIYFLSKKSKVIYHFHCDVTKITTLSISRMIIKWICKKVTKIIAIEKNTFELVSRWGYNNVVILPNFFDFESLSTFVKRQVNNKIYSVSFVGHIKFDKGIEEIIEVSKKNPDIRFNLYGLIDENYKDLDLDNVFLRGELNRRDLFLEVSKSDVFLFPSHFEGFSMALLEAMALKLPIIATDTGATSILLVDEQKTFIVDIGDVKGIEKSLKLLESSELRRDLGILNFLTAKDYSSKEIVPHFIEIYRRLTKYD